MNSIIVNTPETRKQYLADCKADKELMMPTSSTVDPFCKHDTEFVGNVVYVPPILLPFRLSKQDLRELVVK